MTTNYLQFQEIKEQPPEALTLKWYHYNQNNSGGYFVDPAQHVWVQGTSADDVERRFEALGFDDSFCLCCGERWSGPWGEDDLTEQPEYYGKKLTELDEKPWSFGRHETPFGLLVYANGATQLLTLNEDAQ